MDESRCQNCGNAGRLTVSIKNESVDGQICRNVCSRLCAEIVAYAAMTQLDGHAGYRTKSTYEVRPMLTGAV